MNIGLPQAAPFRAEIEVPRHGMAQVGMLGSNKDCVFSLEAATRVEAITVEILKFFETKESGKRSNERKG